MRFPSLSESLQRVGGSRPPHAGDGDDDSGLRFTFIPPIVLTVAVILAQVIPLCCWETVSLWGVKEYSGWDYLFAAIVVVLVTWFVALLFKDRPLWLPKEEVTSVWGTVRKIERSHEE